MKCDICEEEKDNLIPFYWGFFKTEYEPELALIVVESFKGQASDIHMIEPL